MSEIFISYANEDRDRVEPLAKVLEEKGWSVWWDRNIPVGKNFDEVIEKEIDAAKCVIVVWSKHSVSSQWVKTEAEEGRSRGILVPVLFDEIKIPLAFRRIQASKLKNWNGDPQYSGIDLLVQELSRILSTTTEQNLGIAERIPRTDYGDSSHNIKPRAELSVQDFEEIIARSLGKYPDFNQLQLTSRIPQKILNNAEIAFGIIGSEEIFGIIDYSGLGSGKEGGIFTNKGFYFKFWTIFGSENVSLKYSEFPNRTFELSSDGGEILIDNGQKFNFWVETNGKVAAILNEIKRYVLDAQG